MIKKSSYLILALVAVPIVYFGLLSSDINISTPPPGKVHAEAFKKQERRAELQRNLNRRSLVEVSNSIFSAYLKEKNYQDFTNLWIKATRGQGGLWELMSDTNYAAYRQESKKLLYNVIASSEYSDDYRGAAITFIGDDGQQRHIYPEIDDESLTAVISCLNVSPHLNFRALEHIKLYWDRPEIYNRLSDLEDKLAAQPENKQLREMIYKIRNNEKRKGLSRSQ